QRALPARGCLRLILGRELKQRAREVGLPRNQQQFACGVGLRSQCRRITFTTAQTEKCKQGTLRLLRLLRGKLRAREPDICIPIFRLAGDALLQNGDRSGRIAGFLSECEQEALALRAADEALLREHGHLLSSATPPCALQRLVRLEQMCKSVLRERQGTQALGDVVLGTGRRLLLLSSVFGNAQRPPRPGRLVFVACGRLSDTGLQRAYDLAFATLPCDDIAPQAPLALLQQQIGLIHRSLTIPKRRCEPCGERR